MSRGLVAGRFLPPHAGHQFLVEAARALVDELVLALRTDVADPIAPARRQAWLAELFPDVRHVTWDGAGAPPSTAALGLAPADPLFSCDPADAALAARLGLRLVLLDPEHRTIAATSAAIRADPLGHWPLLPPPVRAAHARVICLHGPESTGKSTLAPLLAAHFATIFVPEYGRTYCEQHGLDLSMADLVAIGRGHAAMAEAARRRCNRRLILDTDPLMTAAWADMLFGARDPWFDRFDHFANLYLLLDTDLPWVDDGTRFFGESDRRRRFLELSRAELERRGLPYAVVGGPREERFARALAAIDAAGLG